jgi:hypothetical protein
VGFRHTLVTLPWIEYDIVRGWTTVSTLWLYSTRQSQRKSIRILHKLPHGVWLRQLVWLRMTVPCCDFVRPVLCDWPISPEASTCILCARIPTSRPFTMHRCTTGQTTFVTKQEMRDIAHTDHVYMVVTTYVYSNQNGYYTHGVDCMWEAFFKMHVYTLNFKRFEIHQWFLDRNIN